MLLSEEERRSIDAALALPEPEARAQAIARPHQLVQPGADGRSALVMAERVGPAAAKDIGINLFAETRVPWEILAATPELADQPALRLASSALALMVETSAGPGALLLGPGLGPLLVRAAFGIASSGADEPPPAELGVADRPVLTRLLTMFVEQMAKSISAEGGALVRPRLMVEDLTRLASLKGPMLALSWRFAAPIDGTMDLLLPLPVAGSGQHAPTQAHLASHLPLVEVDAVVELGRAHLRLADLASLRPGMELPLDSYERALLPVLVAGKRLFFGKPITSEGRLAVEIALKEPPTAPMKASRERHPGSR
ncbi:MAG: FliM/FliN family flagellar motor switch protein [Deltaproteobacteria bacterium]|nr:FliM/FliN family flagellar motor switch protein [Deltaproteobacteria bacterium]